jgi:hypothetical protein
MSIYRQTGNQLDRLEHLTLSHSSLLLNGESSYLQISGHQILLLWLISSLARGVVLDISPAWLSDYLDDIP